jgi:lipopolysaccharide export system protein LptA
LDAEAQDKITLNHADSLVGKVINGEQVREATGNVSLTHGDVKIFSNRVVQFIDKNRAELYGSVKVYKDTLSIFAPTGIYYGEESKVVCPDGATLNDSKATLKADYGIYYFIQDMASFRGNVKITDQTSPRKYAITSNDLDYFRSVSKSYARGNVKIVTDSAVIYSDSLVYEKIIGISTAMGRVKIESDSTITNSDKLVYYEFDRKSIADDNVKIVFLNNNTTIRGNHGENYERTNYSFVKGKARLIQIDESEDRIDTLYIRSDIMEAFRRDREYYVAKDSVGVIRSDFRSSSQIGYYFKNSSGKGGVITLSINPAVWKDDLQVTGDSIYAYFKDDIEKIYVDKAAFSIQFSTDFPERYNQISGASMVMTFSGREVDYIRVDTSASSIYFAYEKNKPNGANRVTGETIVLHFKDKQVDKVNVYGLPEGVYYPENMVNLQEFQLPGFKVRKDKPVREF